MGIPLSQLQHSPLQGRCLGGPILKMAVKDAHELGCTPVVNVPEAEDQGLGTGSQVRDDPLAAFGIEAVSYTHLTLPTIYSV